MRAVAVNEWGGRDRMELLDVEPPPVAPDGVLVRVRAAGLNPVDYKVREGKLADKFPHHFPVVLGWDVAGTVEAVGPAVTWFKPGDAVYGYNRRHDLGFGTYAELTTGPEGYFAHMPRELTFEEAAAMPLAALTAHQAIERSGLRGGETFFVPGGAGGVGHLAIQLAVERGARVISTAGPDNQDFLRELGAEPDRLHERGRPRARARALDRRRRRRRAGHLGRRRPRRGARDAAPRRAAWSRSPRRLRRSATASRSTTSSCARAATTSASTSRRSSRRGG